MGGSTKTQKTEYDPAMTALVTGNQTRANNLADSIKPYTGDLTAGTQPLLNDYFNQVGQVQGAGQGLIGEAAGAARSALGYTPMMVAPGQITAANAGQAQAVDPSQALGLLGHTATAGAANRADVRDVNLGAFGGDQIQALFNPFENSKVQSALGDYERSRQMQRGADGDAALAAGAFGGSRHGVADALTNDSYQRNADAAVNDLRLNGWNSALQGALAARGQDLSAAQGNQTADLGVLGQNAETSRFNAGQSNQMGQAGANILGQLQQFNANAGNTFAQNQAGRDQSASTDNINNALQAALANQGAQGNAAQVQIQGGGLLGNLAGQDVARTLGLTGLLGTAGGVQQGLSQEDLDRQAAAYQQFISNQLSGQQVANGATGLIPGVSNTTQTQTQSGGIGGVLGGLGTLALGLGTGGLGFLGAGGALGGLLGGGAAAGAAGGLGAAGLGSFVPALSRLGMGG